MSIALFEYYKGNAREVCHEVKKGNKDMILHMATKLAEVIPKDFTLIPVPNSSGKAEYTLDMCKLISAMRSDLKINDALEGTPRMSLYEAKKQGVEIQFGFKNTTHIDNKSILIDNVIGTGRTLLELRKVIGKDIPVLAYAKDSTNLYVEARYKLEANIFTKNKGIDSMDKIDSLESVAFNLSDYSEHRKIDNLSIFEGLNLNMEFKTENIRQDNINFSSSKEGIQFAVENPATGTYYPVNLNERELRNLSKSVPAIIEVTKDIDSRVSEMLSSKKWDQFAEYAKAIRPVSDELVGIIKENSAGLSKAEQIGIAVIMPEIKESVNNARVITPSISKTGKKVDKGLAM